MAGDVEQFLVSVLTSAETDLTLLENLTQDQCDRDEEFTADIALALLRRLREQVIDRWKITDAMLVRYIWQQGLRGDHDAGEGVGLVSIHRTQDRKEWDHDGWKSAAIAGLLEKHSITGDLADTAGGEVIEPYSFLREVMDIQGSGAPKLTPLRAIGVDPDQFCTSLPGTPTVQFKS